MTWRVENGDALATLQGLEPSSIQCCVTSPPYWGLRDYGVDGQLGLEETPEKYVAGMVEVFREVRRVLRDDGTLWLNLGDCFHNKQLAGIPWRVALALQADGWYLRSDIIWHKTNPIPAGGGVTDRFTPAHEYVFLFAKQHNYYFDMDAVLEPLKHPNATITAGFGGHKQSGNPTYSGNQYDASELNGRRPRDVWTLPVSRLNDAHVAVMPPDLVEPCIKAGTKIGDLVLDPFSGAGTVGVVATRLKRSYVGIELNPEYAAMSRRRIESDAPLFNRAGASHESNH